MNWELVEKVLDDYFNPEIFQYEIHYGDDPIDTECTGVLKINKGLREQKIRFYVEEEGNITFFRIISPLVMVEQCTNEQLIQFLEQNTSWINSSVGVISRQVVYTSVVPIREFEHDHAILGDTITKVARRCDQMETLLYGSDHKF